VKIQTLNLHLSLTLAAVIRSQTIGNISSETLCQYYQALFLISLSLFFWVASRCRNVLQDNPPLYFLSDDLDYNMLKGYYGFFCQMMRKIYNTHFRFKILKWMNRKHCCRGNTLSHGWREAAALADIVLITSLCASSSGIWSHKMQSAVLCGSSHQATPVSTLSPPESVPLLLLFISDDCLQAVQSGAESAETNGEGHIFCFKRKQWEAAQSFFLPESNTQLQVQESGQSCYSPPWVGCWSHMSWYILDELEGMLLLEMKENIFEEK